MSNNISLQQVGKQNQSLKQLHRLIMSAQMQQALNLLQVPTMELSPLIEAEIECNPILEYAQETETLNNDDDFPEPYEDPCEKELVLDDQHFELLKELDEEYRDQIGQEVESTSKTHEDDKYQTYQESLIQEIPTLFSFLMKQAENTFEDKNQLKIAEVLIGNFDDRGFLETPLEEIALLHQLNIDDLLHVLKEIQTFEPYGVGASNLQQSLLIQMICREKRNSLAYQIIENHYDDLIHNRIKQIQKSLKCTQEQIIDAIHHIAKLDLHPGGWYSRNTVQSIVPDVSLREENDKLVPDINDASMPNLCLNRRYLRMLEDSSIPKETKEFIKEKLGSAKWLIRNLFERNRIIERIAAALVENQSDFLMNPNGKLHPMTMKWLSEQLEVHESTIARAVSNKYIDTPRGVLPLRSFFTNGYETNEGVELSSTTIRDMLTDLINREDKKKPLSDQVISNCLKEKGIDCARRTVAKYRTALNIGTALQRKQFGK